MKEKEVRERVETFLKSTLRYVVVPASVGIGLTLIGCGGSSQPQLDGAADSARVDLGTVDVPTIDGPEDRYVVETKYMGPMPPDVVVRLDTPPDFSYPEAAPMIDAADGALIDTRPPIDVPADRFVVETKYMGPMPPDVVVRLDTPPDFSFPEVAAEDVPNTELGAGNVDGNDALDAAPITDTVDFDLHTDGIGTKG